MGASYLLTTSKKINDITIKKLIDNYDVAASREYFFFFNFEQNIIEKLLKFSNNKYH